MKIFLPGASGFVGHRVLHDLRARGHEVVAPSHREADISNFDDMLRAVPEGTEAIVYLPGLLREFPRKGLTFERIHVQGVRNLVKVAKENGIRRWIELSALGARPNASTPYFRTKFEAEELIRKSGLDFTVLRPSVIFDSRPTSRKHFVGELAKAIRQLPFLPILGDGHYRMQPVSLEDVSQSICQSLDKPETIGKTFELGGPDRLSYREIVRTIGRAMKKKKLELKIPMSLANNAARLLGRFEFFPFTVGELTMMKEENIIKEQKYYADWQKTFALANLAFTPEIISGSLDED